MKESHGCITSYTLIFCGIILKLVHISLQRQKIQMYIHNCVIRSHDRLSLGLVPLLHHGTASCKMFLSIHSNWMPFSSSTVRGFSQQQVSAVLVRNSSLLFSVRANTLSAQDNDLEAAGYLQGGDLTLTCMCVCVYTYTYDTRPQFNIFSKTKGNRCITVH